MKKILLFLLAFSVSGCWLKPIEKPKPFIPEVSKATAKQVEMKAITEAERSVPMAVREIKGYFLKNSVKLESGINFFILSSEKRFDEILGASAIESDMDPKPDFKNKVVAVLSLERLPKRCDIKIIKAYAIGSDIYVEYDASQNQQELSYYALSAKIFEIEKPQIATNICFTDAEKNSKVLPLGNRTQYSPLNIDDLLMYYIGVYKGTLPSADGSRVSTVLVISKDYTFNLKQIYLSNSDRVFETSGNWAATSDLSSFVLNYDKPANSQTAFRFVDKSTVEQLDIYGEVIDSGFYTLRK
jgi:hypothetical protein